MLDQYYRHSTDYIQYDHLKTFNPVSIGDHNHSGKYEIYFFISGNAEFVTLESRHKLRFGDVFLLNDTDFHNINVKSDEPYERILIHFIPELFILFSNPDLNLLEPFTRKNNTVVSRLSPYSDDLKQIIKICNEIEELEKNITVSFGILYLLKFIELLVLLNKIYSEIKENSGHENIPSRLISIINYIENNLEHQISLDILEKEFYINGSYLSRLFKKNTGMNLSSYIMHKRIARAQELLLTGLNVNEACYYSGFNNYFHFLKVFKKTTGVSPLQYKKRQLSG
jgi:AraC-like DNA-binding protein